MKFSDLGSLNKNFWLQYQAGTTPGVLEKPSEHTLSFLQPKDRILDAGTGTGELAEWMATKGYDVYAADLNPNEVRNNRQRNTDVHYSVQDLIQKTEFEDTFFKCILFRYVLVNIHQGQWNSLHQEIDRILEPQGYLWLAEPLVSEAYEDRYKLCAPFLGDSHAFYVFKDPLHAKDVTTPEQLQAAVEQNQIARVVRHYTLEEIRGLFSNYAFLEKHESKVLSPSGYPIRTLVALLQRMS